MKRTTLVLTILVLAGALAAQSAPPKGGAKAAPKAPSTREMGLLCWQEFGELVPASITTVLVPFGSLEPHGVIPSGTDSLAPVAMAKDIAERVNALIAPVLNYGMTEAMKAYPGAVSIPGEIYTPFAESVLDNLALQGFKNLIVLNGHGGNSAALNAAVTRVANSRRVRILVVNWWTLADDITKSVFKQNGGHAGNNETAYIQAFLPETVHPERYKPEMASPNPSPSGSYYTVPVESTILLYEKGQGYPTFDAAQAKEYFRKVNDRVAGLIQDTIAKWDMSGVYK
ncbi:MAG TPA: creatininase family protein [Candidatus Bathyarchaeia archaeon]|nr:creatininase family protein [Candidatus Bathyarchaeia archaeon]